MKKYLIPILICCHLFACTSSKKVSESEPDANNQIDSVEKNSSYVLQGWNTWNNPSVLSHVHMPDGLNLQIKFRKKGKAPYWLDAAYVASPKYNFAEKIKPQEHAYDGSYTELKLEWEGTKATIRTATDGDDIMIVYTPDSAGTSHNLLFETGYLWNKQGILSHNEEGVQATSKVMTTQVRAIGNQTNVALPLATPYFSFDSNDKVIVYTGKERTAEEIEAILTKNKKALKDHSKKYGELAEAYNAFQSVVAWNLFYDAFNDRGISSVSRIWNETWGGYIIFDWDTYFIATLASIDNKELAYANVFAITNAITENGFIPNVETPYIKSNDRSQPPVGSITVKLIYDNYGEKWFLEEVYDKLLSWNRWWAENRDNQGYLAWGSNAHPNGMHGHTKQAAKWESGLDNAPMFDEATFNKESGMFEMASAGLMGLYIADCKYLIEIARELGKEEDAAEISARAQKYSAKIQDLWDEESGIFRDKDLLTGKFTKHLALEFIT